MRYEYDITASRGIKERITMVDIYKEQWHEAEKRLHLWGLPDSVIDGFHSGLIYGSKHNKQIIPSPQAARAIAKFERDYGYIVYYFIENSYEPELGNMRTFLYVSDQPSEWVDDNRDICKGNILAYVENITYPMFSEFGSVGIQLDNSEILKRIY